MSYSPEQQRVCDYFQEVTGGQIGCGDDPIGFLISSHAGLVQERQNLKAAVEPLWNALRGYPWLAAPKGKSDG